MAVHNIIPLNWRIKTTTVFPDSNIGLSGPISGYGGVDCFFLHLHKILDFQNTLVAPP